MKTFVLLLCAIAAFCVHADACEENGEYIAIRPRPGNNTIWETLDGASRITLDYFVDLHELSDGKLMLSRDTVMDVFKGPDQRKHLLKYLRNMEEVDWGIVYVDDPFIIINNEFGIPFVFEHSPDMDRSILDGYCYMCSYRRLFKNCELQWICRSCGEDRTPPKRVFFARKKEPDGFVRSDYLSQLTKNQEVVAVVTYDFGTEYIKEEYSNTKTNKALQEWILAEKEGRARVSIGECWDENTDCLFVFGNSDTIKRHEKLEGMLIYSDEWDALLDVLSG